MHVLGPARAQIVVGQAEVWDIDGHLVDLVQVAHVGGESDAYVRLVSAGRADTLTSLLRQRRERRAQPVQVHRAQARWVRQRKVVLEVGRHHSERGQHRPGGRNQRPAHADLPRHPRRYKPGGSPESHQRELARIEAATHRRQPDALGYGAGHDPENTFRRRLDIQAERLGDVTAHRFCGKV